MKEQCFIVREDRRGRGVTVLSRDKTEVSRGWEKVVNAGRWVTNVLKEWLWNVV